MAQLVVDGDDALVRLSRAEKFWAFHGDVRIPLRAISRIRTPSSPWTQLRGWRVAGTGVPGFAALGRRRHGSGYDFSVVHRSGPSVVLECNGAEFAQVIVSVDDAGATATRLAEAAGITFEPGTS